ncbi:glycoside hydrolase family 26 [Candidatus Scalindua japonica]|uniref:Glycoside hydrolase family 26 n=1 Tax=Candidatus Scalindua japonica TaxID=1284222 RepID=A0A286TTK8_9BACT|nr:glycosyl hydrolase [Candidatus Scalindua japonica]GAX59195.1 glycoside hydrolase family 26 [Candidatus Scalindua japonica]
MKNLKNMLVFVFSFIVIFAAVVSCSTHKGIGSDISSNTIVDSFENKLKGWSVFKHPTVNIKYTLDSNKVKDGRMAMKIDYSFKKKNPFIAFLIKDLGTTRDWSEYDSIGLWTFIPEKAKGLSNLSIMAYDDDGNAYIAQHVRNLKEAGWERSTVSFSQFVYSSGPSSDKPLDLEQIRKIAVGIYQPSSFKDKKFSIYIDDIRLIRKGDDQKQDPSGTEITKETPVQRDDGQGISTVSKLPKGTPLQGTDFLVDNFDSGLSGWSTNQTKTLKLNYSIDDSIRKEGNPSLKLQYKFKKKKPFLGFVEKDLGSTRNWKGSDSITFWSHIPQGAKGLIDLSVMLYEEDGSAYIAQHARGLKTTGWKEITVPFSKFFLSGGKNKDENDRLDLDQIRKIGIGIYQPKKFKDKKFIIYVNNIRAVHTGSQRTATQLPGTRITRPEELGKFEPEDGNVYHGVWFFPGLKKIVDKGGTVPWEKQLDENEISEYENLAGRTSTILSFGWPFTKEFPMQMCKKIDQMGKVPHLGAIASKTKPSEVIKGNLDKTIKNWAKGAKEFRKPIFFRFFSEMNGNWNNFSAALNPSETPQMFIQAWRHVVNTFRKYGADNLIFVWAPLGVDIGSVHWTEYYPGDEYVDWVGISVYSFLGNGDPESQIMGIYNDYAQRKPIMIAESAAGDADNNPKKYNPGNRYADSPEKWINRYFDTLEKKAPRVKAFIWFNIEKERVWRIQESPKKLKSIKNV